MPDDVVSRDEVRAVALNTSFADALAVGGVAVLVAWPLAKAIAWVASRFRHVGQKAKPVDVDQEESDSPG